MLEWGKPIYSHFYFYNFFNFLYIITCIYYLHIFTLLLLYSLQLFFSHLFQFCKVSLFFYFCSFVILFLWFLVAQIKNTYKLQCCVCWKQFKLSTALIEIYCWIWKCNLVVWWMWANSNNSIICFKMVAVLYLVWRIVYCMVALCIIILNCLTTVSTNYTII